MMMIPRRRNEYDLFNDFFGGDDFFTRRESTMMKTDIKCKWEHVLTIQLEIGEMTYGCQDY